MGTSPFAVTVLERLAETEHRPRLVITRPDRPRGRGRRLSSPPVADAARRLSLELWQPQSVNSESVLAKIAATEPEALCICAFGALIKEPLLSRYRALNVHPSLLPRWRGPAPIERAIDAGDDETGVTIMQPTDELDAGPVCAQRAEPITPTDDYGSLSKRLELLGANLLCYSLDFEPEFRPQPSDAATFAPKITADDRLLSPARTPAELERRVRALSPHIAAHVVLPDGARLEVLRASIGQPERQTIERGELAGCAGRLYYGCLGGALELLEVKPQAKRQMDAASYLRGQGASLVRNA